MKNILRSVLIAAAIALCGSLSLNAQTYGGAVSIPFYAPANNVITPKGSSTAQPFFVGGILATSTQVFDATGYTQARVLYGTNGSGIYAPYSGVKLLVRYLPVTGATFKDNTFTDYLPLGLGGSDVSSTTTGVTQEIEIGQWTDLDAGAIGNDALILGIVDPSNSNKQMMVLNMVIQFR
jgi:hypothetical protein